MSGKTLKRRSPAVLTIVLVLLGLTAGSAAATYLTTPLDTYKTSIDVNLALTERSIWQGIQPGCYAPQENFDMTYQMRVDSTPKGNKSKTKNGVTTVSALGYGMTPAYGDKSSFRQYSSASPWEIETQYPAGCDGPAPAAPDWAVSPACPKIFERVEASLVQSTIDDPDDPSKLIKSKDGSLLLVRTPKAAPTINGATMGDSCYRTLHDIDAVGFDSMIAISPKETLISIPIPNLAAKLRKLAKGSNKSNPSFKIPISVSGDCVAMQMKPSIGPDPNYSASPFSQPHNALGAFNGDATKTPCMISGQGEATVRREGAVVSADIPIVSK